MRQGIKTQAPVTVPAYWKGKENTTMTEIETLKAQLEAANGKLKDLETRIQNLTLFHRHERMSKKKASVSLSFNTTDKVLTSLG